MSQHQTLMASSCFYPPRWTKIMQNCADTILFTASASCSRGPTPTPCHYPARPPHSWHLCNTFTVPARRLHHHTTVINITTLRTLTPTTTTSSSTTTSQTTTHSVYSITTTSCTTSPPLFHYSTTPSPPANGHTCRGTARPRSLVRWMLPSVCQLAANFPLVDEKSNNRHRLEGCALAALLCEFRSYGRRQVDNVQILLPLLSPVEWLPVTGWLHSSSPSAPSRYYVFFFFLSLSLFPVLSAVLASTASSPQSIM